MKLILSAALHVRQAYDADAVLRRIQALRVYCDGGPEPWIGFDLDGTLACYEKWEGPDKIGKPVPAMIVILKQHLAAGDVVKIFTARVADDPKGIARKAIQAWCRKHIGRVLPITNEKDNAMVRLYDDRAVAVEKNTGKLLNDPDKIQAACVACECGDCEIHAYSDDEERDDHGRWTKSSSLKEAETEREKWPAHIQDLKIPPAWTSVRYAEDPKADLLAMGKDSKGRDQYVYSKAFQDSQAALKFDRVAALADEIKGIDKQLAKDRASGDDVKREHADVATLIRTMGIRPGSEDDTKAKTKAYGATTLEGRHVRVDSAGNVGLNFVGKKGVQIDLPVDDKKVAAMLASRKMQAGDDKQLFPRVSSGSLLDYIHGNLDHGGFKSKDFRTYLGTSTAQAMVSSMKEPTSQKEYVKAVKDVAKAVSEKLGNTPTVALNSYIAPQVFSGWKQTAGVTASGQQLPMVWYGAVGNRDDFRSKENLFDNDDSDAPKKDDSTAKMLGLTPSEMIISSAQAVPLNTVLDRIRALPDSGEPTGRWSTLRRAKERTYRKSVWKKNPLTQMAKPEDAEKFKKLPVKLRDRLVDEAPVRAFDPTELKTNQPCVYQADLEHFARGGKDKEPPIILKTKDGLYVHNGNHRSTVALLSGKKVKGRFIDLSQVQEIRAGFDVDEPRDDRGRWSSADWQDEASKEARTLTRTSMERLRSGDVIFYHGSSADAWKSIKEHGLFAGGGTGGDAWVLMQGKNPGDPGYGPIDRKASVYMSPRMDVAKNYAELASSLHGSDPLLLSIKVPASAVSRMRFDEGDPDAVRFVGRIPPDWISAAHAYGKDRLRVLSAKNRSMIMVVLCKSSVDAAEWSEDQHPRDEHGRFTAGDTNTDRSKWEFGDYDPKDKINGVPLKYAGKPDFDKYTNPDLREEPLQVGEGQHAAAGIVIIEPDHTVWTVTPEGNYGGYRNTFPKGTPEPDETLQKAAVREVYEESGLVARITGVLGDVERSTSTTRYYVGERVTGSPAFAGDETHAVKLMDLHDPATQDRLRDVWGYKTADDEVLRLVRGYLGIAPAGSPQQDVATPLTSQIVMHEKIGGAQGSNAGGFYKGSDGVERYVKLYNNPEQAHGEALANGIYRDLGLNAPNSHVFNLPHGKEAFASDIIPGGATLEKTGLTKENAREVLKGFAADVLTANWDAVGLTYDNILLKNGEAHRIDNGASFMYRAQGGLKPEALLNKATEIKGFFSPGVNHEYAKLAKTAGYSSAAEIPGLKQQVEKIVNLRDSSGGWAKYLDTKAPYLSDHERTKIAGMLDGRTKELAGFTGIQASATIEFMAASKDAFTRALSLFQA